MNKKNKRKLTFVGGDARALIAASEMHSVGYDVSLYGFGDTDDIPDGAVDQLCCSSCFAKPHEIIGSVISGDMLDCGIIAFDLWDALKESDAVILPLPASTDGTKISVPLSVGTNVTFDKLIAGMNDNGVRLVCGGKLPERFKVTCDEMGISVYDYYESEEFAIANAIPTAEGAIEIAMRELPFTINGASALVIGYGRIGKALSKLLNTMGASVTVSARKSYDLAWIRANGLKSAETGKLVEILPCGFDMIFNTVPHTVLGKSELAQIPHGTLIIDLASKPGGVDIAAAENMSHKVIWALSLPGKVAPITSGKIIADSIVLGINGFFGGE